MNALALLLTMAAGCAPSAPQPQAGPDAAANELVWPQPPERPRVRFVGTVARPQDLGVQPSLWRRVGGFLSGETEQWLIRPTDVAARGPVLCIADAGAQALWILDSRAGEGHTIRRAGAQPLVSPVAVAIGQDGRAYVADSYLAQVFVYDTEGELTGTIVSPDLRRPTGLAYDATRDRLYVADSGAHRILLFDGNGRPLGSIGQRGTGQGEFNFPTHVTLDREGDLYVTDAMNFRLQIIAPDGTFTGQLGRHGDSSGDFARPKGVAIDSDRHIYIVEALFDAVQIFDRQGRYLLSFGERGTGPGQFWLPSGIHIDDRDRIYVADSYNQRIQIFEYLTGGTDA